MAEQLEAVRHAEQLLRKEELDREAEELVLERLRVEYANFRARIRYCAAYSEHRVNTAEYVSSRALVGVQEHVFRF